MGTTYLQLADDREPWDRQPGEAQEAWRRFQIYRDLGPYRDLEQTLQVLNLGKEKPVKLSALRQAAYVGRWVERAEAWDAQEARRKRRNHVRLQEDMVERHRRLAGGLIGKAASSLAALAADGLAPKDIAKFIALAADLERKALGEPERFSISGPNGGPVVVEDVSRYNPDERRARLAQIAAELARRSGGGEPDES